MAGGYGNIKPEDGRQFSSEYQPSEKWTEKKALKIGNELIDWLKAKDEDGGDKGNIFFKEFLVVENDYYDDLIDYLCGKFTSFSDLIKRAKSIQELKLVKYGVADRLQPTMTIFCLKNHHGYKDSKELDHRSGDGTMTPDKSMSEDQKREVINEIKKAIDELKDY